MTVKELIAELQKYPDDLPVLFDTEGNHVYNFVEIDGVDNLGTFVGMQTAAPHSIVTGGLK